MKKKRVIPILLHKDGWLVQSKNFNEYKKLGNALMAVQRLSDWDSDELIYLDISVDSKFSTNRSDTAAPEYLNLMELLNGVSKVARMPVTIGGGIRSLQDIENRLRAGADKISINQAAFLDTVLVQKAAREFGSQCIVVSADYREIGSLRYPVISREPNYFDTTECLTDWLLKFQDAGAGEILLNSVTRDGNKCGYDIEYLDMVSSRLSIPIIASGGAGSWEHMVDVLSKTAVDAVAAANIFHFQDQSVYLARKHLFSIGLPVRPPSIN
jgi:cyclase